MRIAAFFLHFRKLLLSAFDWSHCNMSPSDPKDRITKHYITNNKQNRIRATGPITQKFCSPMDGMLSIAGYFASSTIVFCEGQERQHGMKFLVQGSNAMTGTGVEPPPSNLKTYEPIETPCTPCQID